MMQHFKFDELKDDQIEIDALASTQRKVLRADYKTPLSGLQQ